MRSQKQALKELKLVLSKPRLLSIEKESRSVCSEFLRRLGARSDPYGRDHISFVARSTFVVISLHPILFVLGCVLVFSISITRVNLRY